MPPPPSSRSSVSLLNCDAACNYELSCFVFVMDLYMLVCGWYALGGCVLGVLKHLSCFVAEKFCDSSLIFCVVFSERVVARCFLDLPVYFGDAFS